MDAVYLIIADNTTKIGIELAPHDARRAFAKLAHKGRVPIEQIRLSLGHESIQTTERYLGGIFAENDATRHAARRFSAHG